MSRFFKLIKYNHSDEFKSLSDKEIDEITSSEALAEICSDMLKQSEVIENMIEENPTMTKRFVNLIKKVISRLRELHKRILEDIKASGVTKEEAQMLADKADDLQAIVDKWEAAVKEGIKNQNARTAVKSDTEQSGNTYDNIEYSIRDTVISEKGEKYNNVVYLDTDIFNGIKPRNWNTALLQFVRNNLIGEQISVKDEQGKAQIIEFAKANERVTKEGSKNPHKVIDKLARKKDNISKLAVAHSVEIIEVSEHSQSNTDHNHQWLDENGWEHRVAFLMDKKGNIYSATLNIAKTRDGRNILYDINKIKNIGHGAVSSNAEGNNTQSKRDSHINPNVSTDSISQNSENSNKNTAQKSDKDFVQNQDRNLVAVHNLTADELEKSLKLGGLAMPSIAVVKDDFAHTEYGDVSVLFSRDTIDPEVNRDNKVYGGDAWTPTYPRLEYKLNSKKSWSIYRKVNNIGHIPFFNPSVLHPENLEDTVNRLGNEMVDLIKNLTLY